MKRSSRALLLMLDPPAASTRRSARHECRRHDRHRERADSAKRGPPAALGARPGCRHAHSSMASRWKLACLHLGHPGRTGPGGRGEVRVNTRSSHADMLPNEIANDAVDLRESCYRRDRSRAHRRVEAAPPLPASPDSNFDFEFVTNDEVIRACVHRRHRQGRQAAGGDLPTSARMHYYAEGFRGGARNDDRERAPARSTPDALPVSPVRQGRVASRRAPRKTGRQAAASCTHHRAHARAETRRRRASCACVRAARRYRCGKHLLQPGDGYPWTPVSP